MEWSSRRGGFDSVTAKLECPLSGAFTREGLVAERLLLMSGLERDRSHIVRQAVEHYLSQQEGAERRGISVRQFKRLVRAWKHDGAAGLVSRQRLFEGDAG